MKKIFATPLTDVSTSDKEGIGTLRFDGNKVYKYVAMKNTTATVAGVAGDVAAYQAAGGAALNTVVLDRTDADANPIAAGVLQATVTGTAGTTYYGWIQIKGPATLASALGDGADGDMLMAGTVDKLLTKLVFTEGTPNVIQGALCGICSKTASNEVILDCSF